MRTDANSDQIDELLKNEYLQEAVYAAAVQNPRLAKKTLKRTLKDTGKTFKRHLKDTLKDI